MDNIQPLPFLDASTVLTFLEEDADQTIDAVTLPPIEELFNIPTATDQAQIYTTNTAPIHIQTKPFPMKTQRERGGVKLNNQMW